MHYLLGTDEAGYGPNLGPLVISATLWSAPDQGVSNDLYAALSDVIAAGPAASEGSRTVSVCDSKVLYQPRGGLSTLERGVLPLMNIAGVRARSWCELLDGLDPHSVAPRQSMPWYHKYNRKVPVDLTTEDLAAVESLLRAGLAAAGVWIHAVQSTIVYPQQFNSLVERFDSKGTALTVLTLRLIKQMLHSAPCGSVFIVCDKHGARNKYGPWLQEQFPDDLIEIHHESRPESLYRTGPAERRLEFRFQAKGERFLPSALASMVSKYVRELSMLAFNEFWIGRRSGLKPTAGYPVDARRFKRDIAGIQKQLDIPDSVLWRSR